MTLIDLPVAVDDQELWSNVFGSAFEMFGTHLAYEEYLDDTDWDHIGQVEIAMYDSEEDDSAITRLIDISVLAEALPIANRQVYMDLFNFDNYDAICGDAILQVAVLGEVVYG